MCQLTKLGFKITFYKILVCLENILKLGLPPWFYKKNFNLKIKYLREFFFL